jgi:hypothetical protein
MFKPWDVSSIASKPLSYPDHSLTAVWSRPDNFGSKYALSPDRQDRPPIGPTEYLISSGFVFGWMLRLCELASCLCAGRVFLDNTKFSIEVAELPFRYTVIQCAQFGID